MQEVWREPGIIVPIFDPMLPGQDQKAWFSYTPKQRQWWLRVYENKCYFPIYDEKRGFHPCGSTTKLEIHHITPTAWIIANEPQADPNDINFGIRHIGVALCRSHHDNTIHPDMGQAIHDYWIDKEGIKRATQNHQELAKAGIIFWNNEYDDWLLEIARERVSAYRARNALDHYPSDPKWKKTQKTRRQ